MTEIDLERLALDEFMAVILFQLSLFPTLSTGSYVPTGARAADTKAPPQAFKRDKGHSELEWLLRRYERALDNQGRKAIIKEALVELKSWRRAENAPKGEDISFEEEVILRGEKHSPEEVGQSFGIDPHWVRRIRKRAKCGTEDGLPAEGYKTPKDLTPEERLAKILALKQRGMSNRRIAETLKWPEARVRRDLQSIKFQKKT